MERQVFYGVFAVDVEVGEFSDSRHEIMAVGESMTQFEQKDGRFVRAYGKLSDAVADCYDENGWLLKHTMEEPDGVVNSKTRTYYFPKEIEVLVEY